MESGRWQCAQTGPGGVGVCSEGMWDTRRESRMIVGEGVRERGRGRGVVELV